MSTSTNRLSTKKSPPLIQKMSLHFSYLRLPSVISVSCLSASQQPVASDHTQILTPSREKAPVFSHFSHNFSTTSPLPTRHLVHRVNPVQISLRQPPSTFCPALSTFFHDKKFFQKNLLRVSPSLRLCVKSLFPQSDPEKSRKTLQPQQNPTRNKPGTKPEYPGIGRTQPGKTRKEPEKPGPSFSHFFFADHPQIIHKICGYFAAIL